MTFIARRDSLVLLGGIVLAAVLVGSFMFSLTAKTPQRAKAIVIFRMDDPQPRWKEERLRRSIDLFSEERVPLTLGVIPRPLNKFSVADYPSFISYLRGLTRARGGLIEVAQHGYTHLKMTDVGGTSEFAGLPLDGQLEMMARGREILTSAGFEPLVFIPPFDTYDNGTLEAAKEVGFEVFSARYSDEGDPGSPVVLDGIVIINAATSLTKDWETGSVRSYEELKEEFDKIYEKGGVFVLEMHYYRFDGRTTLTVSKLIHYMKGKDVAFMKLGEFGKGYLDGTIRKEEGMWVIRG